MDFLNPSTKFYSIQVNVPDASITPTVSASLVPLHSSTSLPTGGEKQKASSQCQSCELFQDCTVIGAFFCALYSGNRVDAESVSEGYFASAPRPSSVRGEVANGGFAYGLVTRSQSDTNEFRERGEVF